MHVDYINPFMKGACSVLETLLGQTPTRGETKMLPAVFAGQKCNVVFGVTGQVQGSVIYGMSSQTALQIVSVMLCQQVKMIDPLVSSAIAELGNMICGHAMQHLSEAGYVCDITPPTIVLGQAKISTLSLPAIVVSMDTGHGIIDITVGLQSRK